MKQCWIPISKSVTGTCVVAVSFQVLNAKGAQIGVTNKRKKGRREGTEGKKKGRTEGKPYLSTRHISKLCCSANTHITFTWQIRTRVYARLYSMLWTYRHYILWFPKCIESDLSQIPILRSMEVNNSNTQQAFQPHANYPGKNLSSFMKSWCSEPAARSFPTSARWAI